MQRLTPSRALAPVGVAPALAGGGRPGLVLGTALLDVGQVLGTPPPLEGAVGHRLVERAARRADVTAVRKAALLGQGIEVGEARGLVLLLAVVPRRGRPDARSVDDRSATRQRQQLPAGGGVAALARATDLAGLLCLVAEQDVGQGRLAGTRR